jgi:chitodextrinase
MTTVAFAQNRSSLWNETSRKSDLMLLDSQMNLPEKHLFTLNVQGLKNALVNSPMRNTAAKSQIVVTIPNGDGIMENFRVYESSNMDPALAARYPEIKSYVGIGIDNPTSIAYFSLSPLGFKSMVIYADRSAVFIEPLSKDLTTYTVYKKSDKAASLNKFECKVIATAQNQLASTITARPNADDGTLRTFRLAMSCTGEYTVYFGGTKALALAAINNSLTRVNGVFEKDFGAHMNLIANTDAVIYTDANTDPYAPAASMSQWNAQLQSTLTSVIGEANYDIGHLFGATGGGGNAGCIGCVCVNGQKGSGITSPADGIPSGDNFDIDYVAHEMGHQFGGNHTFTFSNEGTIAQVEPGSGTTIMGYAGITGATDVQAHSDPFFHAVSIQQVTNYIKSTTCQTSTATGNAVPTANAGSNYTIPKGTPFALTGSGTDANNDPLTYDWEQMDVGTTTTTYPSVTATTGPAFKSFPTSTSPVRYFPQMATVLTGASSWKWEAVPNVARTLNFRLTVRDNHPGGPANNSADMVVTVNATAGPFAVTSQATAVSYAGGTSQIVTWNVAGTTANNVNCANVDVLLSIDGGASWTTILASTPNNGSATVIIPNTPSTSCRIMVKGTNHIFFNVSKSNFTITAGSTDTVAPTAPTLTASGTTQTTTNLSWSGATDNVGVTGYDVYQGTTLLGSTTTATTLAVTGLSASTTYVFTVKTKDAAGNVSVSSNAVSVTTLAPVPDTTPPTAPTLSASGTTLTTTNLSWTGATDNVGVTGYNIYQGTTLLGSTTTATTFAVTGLTASTSYTFTVVAKDAAGNVSVASNAVTVTTLTPDTTAPTAPTLTASGTTATTTNLSWTGATDNLGVTGYDVYKGTTLLGSTTTATTYVVTGLTASTAYTFTVKAKDAAGNVSVASNTVNVTTLVATLTYCSSLGSVTTDEKIGKVVFGTINNPSTGTAGYEDFTALSTNVTAGTANTITITPAWTSTVYPEGYAVFIDYNQNGVFTDAGETVFTSAASTTTPIVGTFTIPTTASLGATRMRVSLKYNGVPTSCETFSYGQVEDYTVNIIAATPDTTAPSAPTLTASGTTTNTTNLSWSGATDNVGVTGYNIYQGTTLLGSTTTATTFAVTGLTASTSYTFTVIAKDAAGNVSVASNAVTITTLTPDTTAPTAPTLSASGTTATTTNLSWTGATDNVGVTGYDVYRGTTLLGSTTTATTYVVTGLTASTAYTFTVKAKDAAGNVSVASNTVSVTTLANTITYCTSTSSITTDEKIGKVVFGTISNTSTGTAGYEDFTALSTNVVRGTAYTITITPNWTSTVYKEGYAVWIDYNGNGVFTDAGEKVWTKAASTTTPVTGTFTIPATATLGATRMRVQMNYNATPTSSCQAFTYGQVEDYTVNISLTAKGEEVTLTPVFSFNLYPNPVKGDVLNISNLEKPSNYRVYNMMGQEIIAGKIEENSVNVGDLKAGVYLIEINDGENIQTKRFIKE